MDKIAIFCSASDNIDPVYFDKARELGTWMGQNGKTLIYGGANIGLMECVARAAKVRFINRGKRLVPGLTNLSHHHRRS